jgi:HK97 family phage major capsid protein
MSLTTGTLEERQAALDALLNDPTFDADKADELIAEADQVASEIRSHNEQIERREAARARLGTNAVRPVEPQAPEKRKEEQPLTAKSLAEDFATRAQDYHGGKLQQTYDNFDVRSVITTDGSTQGQPFTPLVPQPGIIQVAQNRPLRLAQMVTRAPTTTPVIEYIRDTTSTPQGNVATVAEGGTKPESTYTFDLVSDTVRTVAHFVNISRNAAADHAQLSAYVQNQGLYGLDYFLDDAIINGSGSGTNLRGILNTSGINVYDPANAGTPYTEARLISLRRAMTPIYSSFYAPTAVAINPQDWQWIELSRDTQGMFRVTQNPQDQITPRIWGLNVVQTTAIAAGTALPGDFAMGCTLWDRQEATIYMTDSHASNFTANVLTLLFELRVGLAIHRLGAFTKTIFAPGTGIETI